MKRIKLNDLYKDTILNCVQKIFYSKLSDCKSVSFPTDRRELCVAKPSFTNRGTLQNKGFPLHCFPKESFGNKNRKDQNLWRNCYLFLEMFLKIFRIFQCQALHYESGFLKKGRLYFGVRTRLHYFTELTICSKSHKKSQIKCSNFC